MIDDDEIIMAVETLLMNHVSDTLVISSDTLVIIYKGANGIVSSQERILAFGRYLMQEGAKPISGPNEGEDYHLYQEFYKRKTKLAKDDFVRLKKIIDACNVEALENELDSNVTVQCSKYKPQF